MFINRETNYSLEYDFNEFHIKEIYDKDRDLYTFNINTDNYNYDININHKYTNKRRIVNNISSFDRDGYKCISINVYDIDSNVICNKDNDYYDNTITIKNDNNKLYEKNNISVYSDNYDYLIWNGYGFTNINNDKTYNVLSNESYTNSLAYQFKDYILFADYDQKHEFNKFYIYNNKKKEISSWQLPFYISFDSYFLGYIGNDIYLFDVSNERELRLNIEKKKIKKVNKNGMSVFYDNGKTNINTNKLIYNQLLFKYDTLYNIFKFDDKLYYKCFNSNKYIRLSDLKVDNILYTNNDQVYYMSGNSLYSYKIGEGEQKLAESFEWNFDYLNKIYVFKR
jgi:hypothetical protein